MYIGCIYNPLYLPCNKIHNRSQRNLHSFLYSLLLVTTTTHATVEISQFKLPEPLLVISESHFSPASLKLASNSSHRVRVTLSVAVTFTHGGSDEGCDLGVQEYNASTDQIRM